MPTKSEQGVRYGEQAVVARRPALPDWDSARVFLAIVRQGSFRAAARDLGQSMNALRARIDALEHTLNAKLLVRHVGGVRLTPEGEALFAAAEKMEEAAFGLFRARQTADDTVKGEVRIAISEGIGTFWVAPRLVRFSEQHPGLLLHLDCLTRAADILRMEADIAVQLVRPENSDLIVTKLGRLHFMPCAAPQYLEAHGTPSSVKDVLSHRLVIQADSITDLHTLYDQVFPGVPPGDIVCLRTNVGSAYHALVTKGGGIGVAPTYVYAAGANVVPVDVPIYRPVDIWLSYHPEMRDVPRVRLTIDWLVEAFSPRLYPWFRDEFVHPRDFARLYRGDPQANAFAQFVDATIDETQRQANV